MCLQSKPLIFRKIIFQVKASLQLGISKNFNTRYYHTRDYFLKQIHNINIWVWWFYKSFSLFDVGELSKRILGQESVLKIEYFMMCKEYDMSNLRFCLTHVRDLDRCRHPISDLEQSLWKNSIVSNKPGTFVFSIDELVKRSRARDAQ